MSDLLVTGASGHLGQRVLHHLLDTLKVQASSVVAATRKPETLADWAKRGVETRAIDFSDAVSLAAAFKGVRRALIISTDSMEKGVRLAQHQAAVKAAAQAGVAHVVYTSMPDPEHSLITFAPDHLGTEQALAASSIGGWTVLRNNWYFENLLHGIPHALASGQWYSAAADGKIPYISRDDLARAAATALSDNFTGKRTLTLTGTKNYTTQDIAALVSNATGRPLAVINVPVEGLVQGMIGSGMPDGVARLLASFDANTANGGLSKITADYKTLTGKDAAPLEPWISANVPALTGAHAD